MKKTMKTLLKSIITAVLCAAVVIVGIRAESGTACAAEKKVPLKVVFDKTAVTLVKDLNDTKYNPGRVGESAKLKKLKEKWGGPSKKEVSENGLTYYTWKKGKTSVKVNDQADKGYIGGISIDIGDKNGSMCGIKIGMKKADAVKKLQKLFGKEKVEVVEAEDGEYILATSVYLPVHFGLSDGKVTDMSWGRS